MREERSHTLQHSAQEAQPTPKLQGAHALEPMPVCQQKVTQEQRATPQLQAYIL